MKYISLIFVFIVASSFLIKEDATNVLFNFQKEYSKKNISMEYEIFYTKQDNTREEYEKGKIQIGKKSYYSMRNGTVTFSDDSYDLTIDSKNKIIEVYKSNNIKNKKSNKLQLDSLAIKLKAITNLKYNSDSKSHILNVSEYDYNCSYFFSKSNYFLEKVEYVFLEDEDYKKLTVKYFNTKTGLKNKEIHSSYKDFIKVRFNKITGIKNYKNYTINSHL